jgi:hypothetical protein
MTKVFVLNCFPRQGKDHLAKFLKANHRFHHFEFKSRLFDLALEIADVEWAEWGLRYETMKEIPWEKLGGLSQRQFLIKISEEWIKPVFGERYFGERLADSIERSRCKLAVVSDGGFEQELIPLYEKFGEENVYICQWNKDNSDAFKGDSRNWITRGNIITLPDNDGKDLDWTYKCLDVISNVIGKDNV